MYETFYGMKVRPFALTPDPSFLFMSRKHRFAFSMLEYALSGQAGFTVITGEIGSGKTTLIRHLLRGRNRDANFGVIANTHESFGSLLQWIMTAFGIPSAADDRAARYQAFVRYLITQFGEGKQTILIVDEAQNLSIELLEELRLLSNINADQDQLLQMILVGQPELLEKLRRPELTQFAQRISVNYHLSALSYSETRGYIRHRLRVAGANPELFTEDAIKAVYHFTNGVPRIINSICDMACVYGYAEGVETIDISTIMTVIRDKERDALLPLHNGAGRRDDERIYQAIEDSVAASCAKEGSFEEEPEAVDFAEEPMEEPAQPVPAAAQPSSMFLSVDHQAGGARQAQVRLSPSNIVPIVSQRARPRERRKRMGWLLRLL